MKKIAFILFGALLTTGAFAQTTTKATEEKQLRNDVREVKKQKGEMRHEAKQLKLDKANKERKDVQAAKQTTRKHAKHISDTFGVKHPISVAEDQIEKKADKKEK